MHSNNDVIVSIIIPCFNKGKYIMETIGSVLKQKFTLWECIIVDDGSTDELTISLLKEINHSRIKIIFHSNQGVSATRNLAIHESRGKYILPLDADDLIHEEYLLQAVDVMDKYEKIKVVSSKVSLFGAKKGVMDLPIYSLQTLLARNILVVCCLFRRRDFDQTTGYDPLFDKGFEDWDFWISLLGHGGEVHQLPAILFNYRIIRDSRNHTLNEKLFRDLRLKIFNKHKVLYATYFVDPVETFEYKLLRDSWEYRLGKMLMTPVRKIASFFN